MCKTWGVVMIRIGIKMESRIRIGIERMPIHNTVIKYYGLVVLRIRIRDPVPF
jgi:hypothetical protein